MKENYKYVKLAKLKDIVETTIVQVASRQKSGYDYGSDIRTFEINDPVGYLFLIKGNWAPRGKEAESIKGHS